MHQLKEQRELSAESGLWEESDEVLMVRVSEGDIPAYEALYHRYKNRILTFVYRYVGDREWGGGPHPRGVLEGVSQPAILRSSQPLPHLALHRRAQPDDRFSASQKPQVLGGSSSDDDEPVLEPAVSSAAGPADVALLREMEGKLQGGLAKLSPKLREVFILCGIQGLSYEEVAGIVGCPAKTVSSRLSRARDRFMKGFAPYLSGRRLT